MKTFTTSKNFKFTRTKTGWLDETSGLEWEVEFKTNINQYDAEAWAKEKGKSLPTQEQFIKAEYHGIRELPEMEWKDHWFWSSSTPNRDYADYAYAFSGVSGNASTYYVRNGSYYVIAARLIYDRKSILVSNEDQDLLETEKWYSNKFRNTFYAQNHKGKRLHRIILERSLNRKLVKGELVDHINRNGLDNRRENLRLSNHSNNGMNSYMDKTGMSSSHRGICKQGNRWIARVGKERLYLGSFKTESEAIKVRQKFLDSASRVGVDSEFKIDRTSNKVERLKKAKALITEAMELMEGIWE